MSLVRTVMKQSWLRPQANQWHPLGGFLGRQASPDPRIPSSSTIPLLSKVPRYLHVPNLDEGMSSFPGNSFVCY
jgi:hypothetical protein